MNRLSARSAFFPLLGAVWTLASLQAPVHGQVIPQGDEIIVNTYTTGAQDRPRVAVGPDGFVVVWQSEDGDREGVVARRFDAEGTPRGGEIQVNTYTTDQQIRPSVEIHPDGSWTVVWDGPTATGVGIDVVQRRFHPGGLPATGESLVNSDLAAAGSLARTASAPDGSFVVAFVTSDGDYTGIGMRRVDAAGLAIGSDFVVNSPTAGYTFDPAIASDRDGSFVVAWTTENDGSLYGIRGQRFASSGAKLGGNFAINSYTTFRQQDPEVAVRPDGGFLVAWEEADGRDGDDDGVYARRYGSSGLAVGVDFQINTYTTGSQNDPTVASGPGGDFWVAWSGLGSGGGPYLRRIDAGGQLSGSEMRLSDQYSGTQPHVRPRSDGGLVAVWRAFGVDGSNSAVIARVFCPDTDADLVCDGVFSDGFESGDVESWSSSVP